MKGHLNFAVVASKSMPNPNSDTNQPITTYNFIRLSDFDTTNVRFCKTN